MKVGDILPTSYPWSRSCAAGNINLEAIPASGYDFDHWSGNASGTDPSITIYMDGAKDVMAHFIPSNEFHVGPGQTYTTIQAAIDASSPNGTIIVHDGTYSENVNVDLSLIIRSENGPAATIVQAVNPDDHVFEVMADGVTISGFTVKDASGSQKAGIYLDHADHCNVSNNSVSHNHYGIWLYYSNDSVLANNAANENDSGICLGESSNGNLISNNEIADNSDGIWIEGDNNQILQNDIQDNAGAGSGIHLTVEASGNVIRANNIVGNSPGGSASYGVYNENTAEMVNATLNWWGDASGPHHPNANPDGSGDLISDSVDFEPWFGASVMAVKSEPTETGTYTVDAMAEASAEVIKTGTGTPTIMVTTLSDNPGGAFSATIVSEWIDVYLDDTEDVQQIEIRLYYTPAQIAGLTEDELYLYWWDGSDWIRCTYSGVNQSDDYIWAKINAYSTPSLDDLTGTPFAIGWQRYYSLTVSVTPTFGGTVTLNPSPPHEEYAEGTDVELTAVAKSGYKFEYWSGNATGTDSSVTIHMDGAKIVTANFTEAPSSPFPWWWVVAGVGVVGLILVLLVVKALRV